jgi:basic membrane protein A
MRKQWKALVMMLVVVSMLVAACGGGAKTPGDSGGGEAEFKVALILPGPMNDGGWSATAYNGLKDLEKNHGVKIAFTESVSNSDAEEIIRGYALQEYNWIVAHSFTYGDIVKKVAQDFPDIYFTVNSTNIHQAPNVSSFNYAAMETGFLGGVVAGLITETNKVAAFGGKEIPPIIDYINSFAKGARYVNPDVEAIVQMTGNYDDPARAKETAIAIIERGVDVLSADAGPASLGHIQGAQEKGVYHIGVNADQNPVAPNTVVTSALKNYSVAMDYIYREISAGNFEPKFYSLGVKEGAVGLAPYHSFEDKLSQEVKGKIAEIIDDLKNDRIDLTKLQ